MPLEMRVKELEVRIAALERALSSTPQPSTPDEQSPPASPTPAAPDLESRLAITWLNRLGIITLIGGIVLLLIYAFPNLGAAGKLVSGFICGVSLAVLGIGLRRRHCVFGQVLFAGGMALLYFDAYALHFVPSLQVIDSPSITVALMMFLVVSIVAAAQRMRSESVAGMALFLGYATGVIAPTSAFTFVSLLLLGSASIVLLVVNRWVVVPISSLIAVYLTHLLWMLGFPSFDASPTT